MEQTDKAKNKKLFIGISTLIGVLAIAFFVTKKTDTKLITEKPHKDFATSTFSTTSVTKNTADITSTIPVGKLKFPSVLNAPPGWKTIGTGVRQRIQVPVSAKLSVNGKPLEYGDYLGVFYQSGNELKIAGFLMWKGDQDALYAWGDDLNTAAKDGFSKGEVFQWKIWKNLEKKMYDAKAEFFPIGYGSSTAANSWISGGISTLKLLVGY